jgi:putative ubiquitin-RnfH superfamily antitoxin RatB of RatAB toxin-antitoxin module
MDPADAAAHSIRVELAFSPRAGEVQRIALTLPAGTTIAQALERSGWALPADLRVGIWGRLRELTDALRDRDRLELYRPLTVDPKEARRLRYRSHRQAKKA